MTVQHIIQEAENLAIEDQKKLVYYFFLKFINPEVKAEEVNDFAEKKYEHTRKLKYSGAERFGKIDFTDIRTELYSHL